MFLHNNETTNVPSTPPHELSESEVVLNELLIAKQNLIAVISHTASTPSFEPINDQLRLDRRVNKIIDAAIDQLDDINSRIRELKSTMFQKCYRSTCKYQINLLGSVLSNGEQFGINLDVIKPSSYTDGRISLIEYDVNAYEFSRDQQRLLQTASDIFLNPDDVAAIVTSDSQIIKIATDVLNYVIANDVNLFLQFSPFAKSVYLQCIQALVACLPAHDMIYFNRYLIHFDSVQGLVDHVWTLTLKAFKGNILSTADEWSIDSTKPTLIPFSNESPLNRDERQSLRYPRSNESKVTPHTNVSYNVRIMMLDIFTMIARVYKGFGE